LCEFAMKLVRDYNADLFWLNRTFETMIQDIPICHTLEEAFKLVNDTVGHVEKLRNERRQYIVGQALCGTSL
jgi:hypothetical protein